ncbi:MAG: hypothetical protein HQK79_07465 [Desulfobacterales bacterium]|nr:hypothetical protein [Desulfobacterales bacterium]MBF0395553.1 hypothetical protein [Desulfobacterales bacterium]
MDRMVKRMYTRKEKTGKIIILFFLVFIILLPALSNADFQKTKVAVLDFQTQGQGFESSDMGKIVAEWLITALVKEGRFEVIERRMLEKIIEEQKLMMSGMLDETSATKIGKLLGVRAIITGSVMKLQDFMEVNARIIDVENASIIAAENVKSSSASKLEELVVKMSDIIMKDFPLEGYVVSREKNKVVIDLGKRAGVKSQMKFMIFKEGKVIKHPKTGEILDVERVQTGIILVENVRDKIADAVIQSETSEGAIQYGQLVKNVLEAKNAAIDNSNQDIKEAVKDKISHIDVNEFPIDESEIKILSPEIKQYIEMLSSSIPSAKREAAKRIYKSYGHVPVVLKLVNNQLLKGFNDKTNDDYYVDAMSWLCNILGASHDSIYKPTLEKVANEASNKKLKKYAEKNLKSL